MTMGPEADTDFLLSTLQTAIDNWNAIVDTATGLPLGSPGLSAPMSDPGPRLEGTLNAWDAYRDTLNTFLPRRGMELLAIGRHAGAFVPTDWEAILNAGPLHGTGGPGLTP